MRFLLIAVIVAGLFLFLRVQYRQSPRRLYSWLAGLIGAALVLLVLTGRAHWIVGVVGGILPLLGKAWALLRFLPLLGRVRRVFGGSDIRLKTAWLDVTINRSSSAMDGTVLQGEFQNQRLSRLNLEQLERLLQACSSDPQSTALLRAYLQRNHADWQASGAAGSGTDEFEDSTMSTDTAAQILGVSPKAPEPEIRAAHRKLAQKLHPDRGGNDYLTRKINQARDILLKKS